MATGATNNLAGVIVCRAFLGCFEAAFGAGGPYLLSLFYRRRELGKRVAILMGTSPLANCFAATLAYGILHIHGSIEAWRLLFIIGKSSLKSKSRVIVTHILSFIKRAPRLSHSQLSSSSSCPTHPRQPSSSQTRSKVLHCADSTRLMRLSRGRSAGPKLPPASRIIKTTVTP